MGTDINNTPTLGFSIGSTSSKLYLVGSCLGTTAISLPLINRLVN
jgi:hypothetical protein